MATWHKEIPVGTDGGNSFKLLHWKTISPLDSKDYGRNPRRDCAEQANIAGLTAQRPLHTCVLLPLTSAQSTAAKAGFVWHAGSYMSRGSSLMAQQMHVPMRCGWRQQCSFTSLQTCSVMQVTATISNHTAFLHSSHLTPIGGDLICCLSLYI